MSVRLYDSPGVEITEKDISDYTSNSGSSTALVMGFADSGSDCQPVEFTSKTALVNYFGEPTNEAERYFFAACSEVLAQNGKLVAAKLPYDNASTGKHVVAQYDVGTSAIISSLNDVLSVNTLYSSDNLLSNEAFANDLRDFVFETYGLALSGTSNTELLSVSSATKICETISLMFSETGVLSGKSFDDAKKDTLSTASIERYFEYFSNNSTVSAEVLSAFDGSLSDAYSVIRNLDETVSTYVPITFTSNLSTITSEELDYLVTGEQFLADDKFVIIDKIGGQYKKTTDGKEIIGIVPVVTSPVNALYFQSIIQSSDALAGKFASVSSIVNNTGDSNANELTDNDTAIPFTGNPTTTDSVSERASNYFPQMGFISETELDKEHFKDIGVVVFRAYVDSGVSNKVNFEVVESFVGSLDKDAVDPATKVTKYIETIVNNTSEFIYLFANVTKTKLNAGSILAISDQKAKSFGFTSSELVKDISVECLKKGINTILQKNEDIFERAIDFVVDAGVSSIGQYIACVYDKGKGPYNPCGENSRMFKLRTNKDREVWFDIIQLYNTFCSKTRKDCIFLCDSPRSFCIEGKKAICRQSKPSNTVDSAILPLVKFLAGHNTTYGGGYCDWFLIADEFTGETFWCPPSIQAVGAHIYTNNTYFPWYASAGMTRGVVTAVDCAFNPNRKQASQIYNRSWNYATNYADFGIVLEGQKTLTLKKTSLDRLNVRKLLLYCERRVFNIARQFIYEMNTAYTRQRFVDRIDPIFQFVKGQEGIYDYRIIADESINTAEVINNSEMRCRILLAPTKVLEYIILEFVVTPYGMSFDEIL